MQNAETTEITLEIRDPSALSDHPLNAHLYGDVADDQEFLESCRGGILESLLITSDNVIISGHRRNQAAVVLGLDFVLVTVRRDLSDPLDIAEALIRCNSQRVRTVEQRAREYKYLLEIESARAKRRQATSTGGAEPQLQADQPPAARASDVAADAIGMSRTTAEQASVVVDAIDSAVETGDDDRATELRSALETGSVSVAHQEATKPKESPDATPVVVDALKRPVAERFRPIFETLPEFRSILRRCSIVLSATAKLAKTSGGARIHMPSVRTEIGNLRRAIKFAAPHAVCPYCNGTGRDRGEECRACKTVGWVARETYDQAPEDNK